MASPSKRLAKAAKDYKFSGPQTGNQEWQKWDLLPQIGQYMDPHCIVKMLIAGNSPYAENYMGDEGGFYDRAFIETNMLTNVLRSTDMPQMLKDRAGHEIPEAELDQEQENINQYISKLQQEIMHVLQIMENSEA